MQEATGAPTAPSAENGPRTDRLELLQQLGGAAGVVHKARNPKLNRIVALRQLQVPEWLDDADDLIRRLLTEARAASALNHPSIARLYTGGYKGFTVFLTTEFADGVDIRQYVATRKAGLTEIVDLAKQLCAALDCAADKRVCHHAMTPANLKVLPDGTLKVLDFGLLRDKNLYSPTPAKRLESEHYLSPEQLRNKPVDRAANLFSAASILYELFTSRSPFAGKHLGEVDRNILDLEPSPASVAHPRVPEAISRVLMKGLSKSPEARFQTGQEFATALEEALTGTVSPGATAVVSASAVKPAATSASSTGKSVPVAAAAATPLATAANAAPVRAAKPLETAPPPAVTTPEPAAVAPVVSSASGSVPASTSTVAAQATKAAATAKPAASRTLNLKSLPGKLPVKMLMQWWLVGGLAALIFVVSALALSLSRRSKGLQPAPKVTQQESHPVRVEVPAADVAPITTEPAVETKEPERRANRQKVTRAVATPAPATIPGGQLAISSEPDGANISIEGRAGTSQTPQTLASLAPGTYKVTVSKPGYATETRSIEVLSDKRSLLAVKLTPLKATLKVATSPAGARILIDGKESGKFSPAEFTLDPAVHRISVLKEGYFEATTEMKLVAGQATSYAPSLKAAGRTDNIKVVGSGFKKLFGGGSSEGLSRIEIKTEPKGAQVVINGNTLPKSTPFEIQLEPGNYEITVQKDGYKPIHKSLTTQPNDKLRIDEQLTQQPK
jgi:Protein kinase domain/PEGA domain